MTFQLPPSHEGELEHLRLIAREYRLFQLPPSHEGERGFLRPGRGKEGFQLPPSHEGEPSCVKIVVVMRIFQLPPSHECERRLDLPYIRLHISTPALA